MNSLLGWLLLLGGLTAALVGMFAMSAEGAGQAVVVFGGLAAVVLGAVSVLVIRMSGTEGAPPAPPTPPRGFASPTALAPFAAKAPDRAARRPRLPQAPAGPSGVRSRRLGSAVTWAVLGAVYYLSRTSGSGSWLEFMVGLLFLATPFGIVATVASRALAGRAWSWAVNTAIAGIGFIAGVFLGAFVKGILGS